MEIYVITAGLQEMVDGSRLGPYLTVAGDADMVKMMRELSLSLCRLLHLLVKWKSCI
ncbi:MAG: hypothetical protein Ct9H300mP27_01550 [Chloroflexota bacterium]|nr:MAG: hypothetical protein Ct9H300mP27_01550 [Chloroflexota bacterium]